MKRLLISVIPLALLLSMSVVATAQEAIIFCQDEECNNFNLSEWVKKHPPKEQPSPCKELTFKGTLKCDGVTMDLSKEQPSSKAGASILECDYSTVLTSNPPQYNCTVNGKATTMTQEEINNFGEQPDSKELAIAVATINIIKESDSEKWRLKCEEALKLMDLAKNNTFAPVATAYCTRYNASLMEEIKDKLK